MLCVKRVVHI
ncbi:hypothetical protein VCCP1035_1668A, partial [Vibrio cholerae CP1035(8)]